MTQPGQFEPPYGQGGSPQQPGYAPSLPGQPHAAPPLTPYGNAMPATGYGPQLSFAMPPGAELASVGRRIGGYFMELLLAIVTLGIGYLIWMLVVWARGQTPGKQVLGMYCYRPSTGSTASWGYMLLRWLGQALESLIPFGFPITAIMMIVSSERKAIHDHIAGTVVLHRTS
ncbi:MAG: RDD family protein [Jatrophihabitantaceae bacterium]